MKSFRNMVDLTPWDKSGGSFNGLTRGQSKFLGLVFITVGLVLADPPFSVLPGDFLNIGLAHWLNGLFSVLGFNMALVLTYALIGPLFFLLGIWIYPYNTGRLFSGYVNKAKRGLRKVLRSPFLILLAVFLFFVTIRLYKQFFGVI